MLWKTQELMLFKNKLKYHIYINLAIKRWTKGAVEEGYYNGE
jgi:hypothetical protein